MGRSIAFDSDTGQIIKEDEIDSILLLNKALEQGSHIRVLQTSDDLKLQRDRREEGVYPDVLVYRRTRPDSALGFTHLPEFWLTLVFALLLPWSLVRDYRTLRPKPEKET